MRKLSVSGLPRPPRSTLFPYTTLFRSQRENAGNTLQATALVHELFLKLVDANDVDWRSEEHTSELQSHHDLVCRLLLEKKKRKPASAHRVISPGCGGDRTWQPCKGPAP